MWSVGCEMFLSTSSSNDCKVNVRDIFSNVILDPELVSGEGIQKKIKG